MTSSLNAQVPSPPAWTIARTLRIDAAREDLINFSSISVGPRGEILIPQNDDGVLLIFSAAGQRIASIGRTGQGPGEFQRLGNFGWVGDTIWAGDHRAPRVSLFTTRGHYVRQIPVTGPPMLRRLPGSPTAESVVSDGSILVSLATGAISTEADCHCFAWMSPSGVIRNLVSTKPPPLDPNVDYEGGSSAVPFGWNTERDATPDGSRVGLLFATRDDRERGRYRVVLLGQRGDTILNRTYEFERVRIPQSEVERALQALAQPRPFVGGRTFPGVPQSAITQLRARVPTYYQPWHSMGVWQGIRLGADGSIWISLRKSDAGFPWLVLDERGNPIGSVTLPANVWLFEATRDQIWASEENSDGLRSLVRYSISRRG